MKKYINASIQFWFRSIFWCLLFSSSSLFATTFYVSPSGLDSNSGLAGSPFKTIQKAADIVNPGDTVIVENGIYTAAIDGGSIVNFRRGGTSKTSMITFKSRNEFGAKLDGTPTGTRRAVYGFRFSSNYIRVEGFELYGMSNAYDTTKGCAAILVYASDGGGVGVEIAKNYIHDIGRLKTETINGLSAIYIQQNNVLVEGNIFHNIGRLAPGENGATYSTGYTGYQNHDHGIYHSGGNDVTIRNNIFYNCLRGFAIQAYPTARARMKVLNNTFAFPNPYSRTHITFYNTSSTDSLIANNIFYKPGGGHALSFTTTGSYTGTTIANNLTHQGDIADRYPSTITFTANQNFTDPLFVNAATIPYDFYLRNGSPAIDTGKMLSEVVADFDGASRPQGAAYDIGAYEYVSSTVDITPPSVPTGLVATPVSSSQINLSWTASIDDSGVTGYRIYRGGVWVATSSATAYSDGALNPSTVYSYQVAAFDAAGNVSSQSIPVSATTMAASGVPAAPSNLTAIALSKSQVKLTWTDNSNNETKFQIQRARDAAFTTSLSTAGASANATTYTYVSLKPGRTYYFRVWAVNGAGRSGYSNIAIVTTPTN
jgi:hypothetical protein